MLKEDVKRYVQHHRDLGFKYRVQSGLLNNFASFAEARGEPVVHSQSVIDWAGKAPSPQQQRNRLLTVRRFALVMQTEDERHQVPPSGLFGQLSFQRCIRHIFTTDEVLALIQAAKQLPPAGTIRPATFSTMFGLLAATGLRSSEALALTFADITTDGLIVSETKFRKSRLVPLHETTMHVLEQYLTHRKRCRTKSDSVFVSQRGTSFSYVTVNHVFLALLRNLGFRKGPGHPGPCLHDLRHTFAVRSLEQCIGDSEAIKRHMVGLSTYLGHAHISDTYWYLQATPRLMSQISLDGESLFQGYQP